MRGRRPVFSADGLPGGTQSISIPMRRAAQKERLCVRPDPDIAHFQMAGGTQFDLLCNGVLSSDIVPGARLSYSNPFMAAN